MAAAAAGGAGAAWVAKSAGSDCSPWTHRDFHNCIFCKIHLIFLYSLRSRPVVLSQSVRERADMTDLGQTGIGI